MAYSTYEQVVRRWVDVTEGTTDEKFLRNPRVPVIDGRLYAFDRNFELVRAIRNKSGKVTHYVLNGDELRAPFETHTTRQRGWYGGYTYTTGGGTTSHQAWVRRALTNRRQVIIPFTALEEAGIDIDSVKIIDVLPDRNETIQHTSKTIPEGAGWITEQKWKKVERSEEDMQRLYGHVSWAKNEDGSWREWYKFETVDDGLHQVLHTSKRRSWSPVITITEENGEKVYKWETHHHWLGESLIRAKVIWKDAEGKDHSRWAYFLSGFDHQEPMPLYFFAEMPPKVKPTTVEEAYQFLKPEPVLLAEQMGRRITRQGDIFAIAAPSLDRRTLAKMGAVFEKRSQRPERGQRPLAMLLGTNHRATEVARMPNGATLARGQLYHDPIGRDRDHVARKLGDGQVWHLIIKNTVPDAVVRR